MNDMFDSPIARQIAELQSKKKQIKSKVAPKPAKTRVFAVSNQKGGVGKTTSTVNIAAAFATLRSRVLVVDLDPQGNASTALNVENRGDVMGTYEVLIEDLPFSEAVQQSPDLPNLTCCPANLDLAGSEIELVTMERRESRLRDALNAYLGEEEAAGRRFDYVFIDCPPSLGLLTINALVAAGEVLIPIQAEYYALEGLTQLSTTIEQIHSYLNPQLYISTILLTMFDKRTNLAHEVGNEVRKYFESSTLKTMIPRSVRISEAPSYRQTVITYDPEGVGAVAYKEAALEIAERGASK